MDIDALTGQLERILERARAGLTEEVAAARKAVAAANAERTAAQNALAELHDRRKQVQADLDGVIKHLDRASNLAALDAQIKTAQTELEKVKAEITKANTAAAVAKLEQSKAEAARVQAWNETSQLRAEGRAHSDEIRRLRTMLAQVEIGRNV